MSQANANDAGVHLYTEGANWHAGWLGGYGGRKKGAVVPIHAIEGWRMVVRAVAVIHQLSGGRGSCVVAHYQGGRWIYVFLPVG